MDDASQQSPTPGLQRLLGTGAIAAAVAIAALALGEMVTGQSLPLPRTWFVHRPLWIGLGILSLIVGCRLLRWRPGSPEPDVGDGILPGVRFESVILYSKPGCHLCDEALTLLQTYAAYLPEIDIIDISTDDDLQAEFGTSIPVVRIDGQIRFRGTVNELLLRRLIAATPPID